MSTFAYFEFAGEKEMVIKFSAQIPVAFGKLPNTPDNTWGVDINNPFLIQNTGHMKNLEVLNNRGDLSADSYYFEIMPNEQDPVSNQPMIDMTGIYMEPIGNDDYPFIGKLNGSDSVIKNVTVVANHSQIDIGLFGIIGVGASVHNLILQNPTITSINNYVGIVPNLHKTVKMGVNQEKCHIGVLCGHLEGNIGNISIKDAVIDINSPATTGYMDYFSAYTTVGYVDAATATINEVLVSALGNDMPIIASGDTGYWYSDFYHNNVGGTVTYIDVNNIEHTVFNFLRGGPDMVTANIPPNYTPPAASTSVCTRDSNNLVVFNSASGIRAKGIFEMHTGNGYRTATINSLGGEHSSVMYVPSGSNYSTVANTTANSVPISLNPALYNDLNDPNWIFRDFQMQMYDPYGNKQIESFTHGIQFQEASNNSRTTIFNEWTGVGSVGDSAIPSVIYFKIAQASVQNPAKIFILAKYGTGAVANNPFYIVDTARAIANNNVLLKGSTTMSLPNDGNLYAFELEFTQNGEYGVSGMSDTAPLFAYLAVGGQIVGENDHRNVERYASLPTVDYIYDVTKPVTASGYQYSKVLPYFLYGTGAAPLDTLRLEFNRQPGNPQNFFTINASGKDALASRLGSNGYPVFDFIDKRFPNDDIFVLNRNP